MLRQILRYLGITAFLSASFVLCIILIMMIVSELAATTTSTYSQKITINRAPVAEMVAMDADEAALNPCAVFIEDSEYMFLIVYYLHESGVTPGIRYTYYTLPQYFSNTYVGAIFEGWPVAFEYRVETSEIDFDPLKICGDIPSTEVPHLFRDGFESGNTDAWSLVIGDGS